MLVFFKKLIKIFFNWLLNPYLYNTYFNDTFRSNTSKNFRKLGSPDSTKVALICSMYHTALQTMTQVKLDILTGKFFI